MFLRLAISWGHAHPGSRRCAAGPCIVNSGCRLTVREIQGYLAHKRHSPPPSKEHHMTLGIVILKDPRRGVFLMSEAPLYWGMTSGTRSKGLEWGGHVASVEQDIHGCSFGINTDLFLDLESSNYAPYFRERVSDALSSTQIHESYTL